MDYFDIAEITVTPGPDIPIDQEHQGGTGQYAYCVIAWGCTSFNLSNRNANISRTPFLVFFVSTVLKIDSCAKDLRNSFSIRIRYSP